MELPRLQRPKTEAINLIGVQIKRGRHLNPTNLIYETAERHFREWERETLHVLMDLFDTDRYANEFKIIDDGIHLGGQYNIHWKLRFDERLNAKIGVLKEVQRIIDRHYIVAPEAIDFWPLIHPEIITVTKTRFETGHYADCAEAAFKHINSMVKDIVKSAIGKELDGANLMRTAFSATNPVIEIEEITTDTGKNVQLGYMDIFAGSMTGIRNPKAHAIITIGRERAIHFIFLASLLMDTIDIALNRYRHEETSINPDTN